MNIKEKENLQSIWCICPYNAKRKVFCRSIYLFIYSGPTKFLLCISRTRLACDLHVPWSILSFPGNPYFAFLHTIFLGEGIATYLIHIPWSILSFPENPYFAFPHTIRFLRESSGPLLLCMNSCASVKLYYRDKFSLETSGIILICIYSYVLY